MQYIAIAVCAACFLVSWKREKSIFGPGTMLSGLWMIITILASMKLYGLYEADSFAYLLITIGIVFFGLGCALKRRVRFVFGSTPKEVPVALDQSSEIGEINITILHILCIFSALMMIYPDYLAIKFLLVNGFDMTQIRAEFDMPYSNLVLRLLYNYVVLPFSFAASPIFAATQFLGRKKDNIVLFSVSFIVFSRLLTEGGRVIVLYFLLAFLAARSMTKTKQQQKRKIAVYVLIALGLFAVFAVTNSRTNQSLFEHLYIYLCGVVPHLSARLKEVNSQGILTYGLASVFGYVEFIFTMLENIGFPYPSFIKVVADAVNQVVQTTIPIANNDVLFNAFVSPIYYMYCDGRTLGVIIEMFLYGMVSFHFYQKFQSRKSYRNLALYLLILQGLVFSFVRIQFAVLHYALAFFFICFVFDNKIRNAT